jgi:hypothetical protein
MPSHAIPSGRDGRAHRTAARRRRLRGVWQRLPVLLVGITSLQVAGRPESVQGSAAGQVLSVIRIGLLAGLVIALVVIVVAILEGRLKAQRASRADPRPRWQYLLAAFGWLGAACCFVLASRWTGTGVAERATSAAGIWSGAYGLVMIGRAACWGRVRAT